MASGFQDDAGSIVSGRSSTSSLLGRSSRRSTSSAKLKRKRGPAATEKYVDPPDGADNSKKGKRRGSSKRFKKIRRFLAGRLRKGSSKKKYNAGTTASTMSNEDQDELDDIVSLNSSFNSIKTSDGYSFRSNRSIQSDSPNSPSFNLAPILNNDRLTENDSFFDDDALFPGSVSFLSVSDSLVRKARPKKIFKIVLLLVDPETRRFELLHLEFESGQVHVTDVITQVTESVTEEALRKKVYTGLSSYDGIQRTGTDRLATFCKENDILVAIPINSSAKKCVELATPIIADDKIQEMFTESCIDASSWKQRELVASAIAPLPSSPVDPPPLPDVTPSKPHPSTKNSMETTAAPQLPSPPPEVSRDSIKLLNAISSPEDAENRKPIHHIHNSPTTTTASADESRNSKSLIPTCLKDSPRKNKYDSPLKKKENKSPQQRKSALTTSSEKSLTKKSSVVEINLSADVLASILLAMLVGFVLLYRGGYVVNMEQTTTFLSDLSQQFNISSSSSSP